MKHFRITLIFLFIFSGITSIKAQKLAADFHRLWGDFASVVKPVKWTAGMGWNIISDDGDPWHHQFAAKKTWNLPPYPTNLSLDGYFKKGISFGVDFSYNRYKTGKLINGDELSPSGFFAVDASCKYNFCELYDFNKLIGLGDNKVFDIFGTGGFGYTSRHTQTVQGVATLNLGFGMNAWVYENWGIQLQAQSKFGLCSPFFKTPANYLQYNFGVIYQFSLGQIGEAKAVYHLKQKF
jgi:hypothetical protein